MSVKKAKNKIKYNNKGFSLLEILVVMMIIALMVTLVGPRLIAQFEKSKVTTARAQIASLYSALNTYYIDIGTYPKNDEGLQALVKAPEEVSSLWFGPYLDGKEVPFDPWGTSYQYKEPLDYGNSPTIYSLGADKKIGGEKLAADVYRRVTK